MLREPPQPEELILLLEDFARGHLQPQVMLGEGSSGGVLKLQWFFCLAVNGTHLQGVCTGPGIESVTTEPGPKA